MKCVKDEHLSKMQTFQICKKKIPNWIEPA